MEMGGREEADHLLDGACEHHRERMCQIDGTFSRTALVCVMIHIMFMLLLKACLINSACLFAISISKICCTMNIR